MSETPASSPVPSRRGGKRPNAGRKPKNQKATSALPEIDLTAALNTPPPDDIESAAQTHSRDAIASLVKQLVHGKSETAKVNAANAILDRGYGKPSVDVGGLSQLSLFGGGFSDWTNCGRYVLEDIFVAKPFGCQIRRLNLVFQPSNMVDRGILP